MIKLSGSRKRFSLEVFAVFIVCAFLTTSLVPSIGHSETSPNTKPIYVVHSNPFVLMNNNSSNIGYVKYTLLLSNDTVFSGNYIKNENGFFPSAISFDSNNGYLYVTNSGSNNVSVINGSSNTVIGSIIVGVCPRGISFDSNNGYIFILNFNSQTLSVISSTQNTVINTITLPGIDAVSISFDPKDDYIYVMNSEQSTISVINGSNFKVLSNIDMGSFPDAAFFDPVNEYMYIANSGTNSVSAINTSSLSIIYSIPVGYEPNALSFDTSNGYMYVTNARSDSVSVINGSNFFVTKAILLHQSNMLGISFDSNNGYMYVANSGSNNVSVIKGSTNTVVGTISVGTDPHGVSFDHNNGYICVANSGSNNTSVINGLTNTVVGTISVGTDPTALTFDTKNGYLYVTNYLSGTVGIAFLNASYTINIKESGLPLATSWYVNLSNGQSFSSITSTTLFSETNGTYAYTISTFNKSFSPSPTSGSFAVKGASVYEGIIFSKVTYKVTFAESGLPSGT